MVIKFRLGLLTVSLVQNSESFIALQPAFAKHCLLCIIGSGTINLSGFNIELLPYAYSLLVKQSPNIRLNNAEPCLS